MYDLLEPSMDPGTGVSFASISVVATNRSGSARVPGDVVCFCLQNSPPISSDGVTISMDPGAEGYYLSNFTAPSAADTRCQYYGVLQDSLADMEKGRVLVKGITQAKVIDNSGATSIGAGLGCVTISTNAYYLDARGGNNSATAPRKIMAITLEDYAASSITATSIKGIYVLFDGINGFGGTAL